MSSSRQTTKHLDVWSCGPRFRPDLICGIGSAEQHRFTREQAAQPGAQAAHRRQATRPGPVVLRPFSQARAWRPAVGARLAIVKHRRESRPAREMLSPVCCLQ